MPARDRTIRGGRANCVGCVVYTTVHSLVFIELKAKIIGEGCWVVSMSMWVFLSVSASQTLSPRTLLDVFQQIMAQIKADNIIYWKMKSFLRNLISKWYFFDIENLENIQICVEVCTFKCYLLLGYLADCNKSWLKPKLTSS
jgi:hypothetical protein